MSKFSELLACKKNFVFIGETGSGKSEIALNVAVALQKRKERSVHVFDLDQTKARRWESQCITCPSFWTAL